MTLAKQMYSSETAWFIKEYEEAVWISFCRYQANDSTVDVDCECFTRRRKIRQRNFPRTAAIPQTINSDGTPANFADATHSE